MIFCINQILFPALALGITGAFAAAILCFVVRRFTVKEDSRIEEVEKFLPGANCGACGFMGCHDFAVQCVKRNGPIGINCPGAGSDAMEQIAAIFGQCGIDTEEQVAVLLCNGSCGKRHIHAIYDGPQGCRLENRIISGVLTCGYGCLQCGDCIESCPFGAISINQTSLLPEINESICTGCGVCTTACPRNLLRLQPRGQKKRRIWVACSNRQRGALALKACGSACIGCGKCFKACPFGAIELKDNLASIDPDKCRLCRKCVDSCPTKAIIAINFPNQPKTETAKA